MPETADERANRRIDEVLDDLLDERKPRHKLTKREAEALIGDFWLQNGGGQLLTNGGRDQNKLCIMQTVNVYHSVLAGVKLVGGLSPVYSDVDQVDPVIEQYLINMNDAVEDTDRQRLLAYVPKLLNTKVSEKTSRREKICRQLVGEYAWRLWRDEKDDFFDIAESRYNWETGEHDLLSKTEFMEKVANEFEGSSQLAEFLVTHCGTDEAFKVLDRLLRAR